MRTPLREWIERPHPPGAVLGAAALAMTEGLVGIGHSIALLLGIQRPADTVGLAAVLPVDADTPIAVAVFLLAVGLLLAAAFLMLHSRISQLYALALQALAVLDVIARLVRRLPFVPALTLLGIAAAAGVLLLSPSLRRWCHVPVHQ